MSLENSYTKYKTYESRLNSFKSAFLGDKKQKWNPKAPSMVSLARAFFYFSPAVGMKDRVVCAECGLELHGWTGFRQNPIQRHSGLNTHCCVSALGQISVDLLANAKIRFKDVAEACIKTFRNENKLGMKLATKGFIYVATSEYEHDTVGCIACLCFPQNANDNPMHSAKCPLPDILSSAEQSEYDRFRAGEEVNTPSRCMEIAPDFQASLCDVTTPMQTCVRSRKTTESSNAVTEPSHPRLLDQLLPQVSSVQASFPRIGEDSCFAIFEAAKTESNNGILAFATKLESGSITEIDALNQVEHTIVGILEKAHAKRINLIRMAAEEVAIKLIEETQYQTS